MEMLTAIALLLGLPLSIVALAGVAMLLASGVHPTMRPLGPSGERCAACASWVACRERGVRGSWRACAGFSMVVRGA